MNEIILFNPGDSIASGHDFGEAVRSAEIYKHKDSKNQQLVIVRNVNDLEYAVFSTNDAVANHLDQTTYQTVADQQDETVLAYTVEKEI